MENLVLNRSFRLYSNSIVLKSTIKTLVEIVIIINLGCRNIIVQLGILIQSYMGNGWMDSIEREFESMRS